MGVKFPTASSSSTMPASTAIPSGPRSASRVVPLVRRKADPDELAPDYMGLLSLLFGLAALYMRIKACSWVALFFWLNSMATAKPAELDYKQAFMSFVFAMMSLVLNYFGPRAK